MYTPRCAVVPLRVGSEQAAYSDGNFVLRTRKRRSRACSEPTLRGARDLLTARRDASPLHLGANVCFFTGPYPFENSCKVHDLNNEINAIW